jgi:cyanate permease
MEADTGDSSVTVVRANRYRFVIYGLIVLANATTGLNFLAPSPFLTLIIDDLDISKAAAGFLVTTMTLTVTVAAIPASIGVVKWRLKPTFGLAWVFLGAGVLIAFYSGFWALVGIRLLQGLGAAIQIPLIASLIMRWTPEKELPAVNAIGLAALTVGLGSGLVVGPFLAESSLGWPGAMAVESAVGLVGAAAWFVLGRAAPGTVVSRQEDARLASTSEVLKVFRSKTTWLLAVAVVGPWAQFTTLSAWLPTFFTDVRGMDLGVAGFTTGVFTMAGIPAALLGGALITRTGTRRPILLWSGLLIGAGGVAIFVSPVGWLLYAAVMFAGVVQWAYEPAIFTLPIELPGSSPERAGAIWAAILTVGNAASFVAPVFVGRVNDVTGSFVPGFAIVCVTSLSLFFAALFIPETGPGRKRSTAEAGVAG